MGGDIGPQQPLTTTTRSNTSPTPRLPPPHQHGQAGDTLLSHHDTSTTNNSTPYPNNNTNSHTHVSTPRTTIAIHRSSSKADVDRDMNNTELDLALASLIPTMVTLPATCTLDIINLTNTLPTALTSRGNTTILLPMWFRHHWVLGALHGDTLDVWDSAPSPLVKEDILRFAATLALRLGTTLRVRGRATSRQPWGTRQCGTHAIVRAVLLSLNLNFALPTDQVVDFELLRRVLPTPSRNTAPIAALLASVAHPNYIDAATNNTRIPPLQAASIRECLRSAKGDARFLLAYHTSAAALPNDWAWGVATVLRASYSSTSVSWLALAPHSVAKKLSLPSAALFAFALAPLKAPLVDWDRHTGSSTRLPFPELDPHLTRQQPHSQPSWRPADLHVAGTLSIARLCNTKGRGLYRYPNFRLSNQYGPCRTHSQQHVNCSS